MRRKVAGTGLEQTRQEPGKTANLPEGGAKGGAVEGEKADPDLARIIAAWPRLRDNVKAAILAMIESAAR